jgi:hypothetical protein
MPKEIELAYDAGKRRAVLTFPNGRALKGTQHPTH